MAKAKKTTAGEKSPETTTAKPAGKKAVKAKKATPVTTAGPMIDTGLAAEVAAKNLVAKVSTGTVAPSAAPKESAGFKNLKASVSNPVGNSMANFLDKTGAPGQKKSNLPFHGGKQLGRNQTFGADVNRSGVPRRTGG